MDDLVAAYEKEQEQYIQSKIEQIQQSVETKKSALAWQITKEISGKKHTTQSKLRADSEEERRTLWQDHFKNLLGKPPKVTDEQIETIIHHDLDIKQGNFSYDELDKVLKSLKNKKAAGLDGIPPEVWKTRQFDSILLELCNKVYYGQTIEKWTKGCILPFPKKGDLGVTKNYRGITLTAIAAKIYNAMLHNRICPEIENILRKNQNGFRKSRSTVSQILTVRRIIEGVKSRNLEAVLLFVDFSKAFDSIHRGKMEQILLAYGIPNETVKAVMMLYNNSTAMVRSPDGDTDFFEITAGVLQGDTLAPYLFIICLDYVLRTSVDKLQEHGLTLNRQKSKRHPAKIITDADYADDLALFADTTAKAELLLHSLEKAASGIGLYVNADKTEYMSFKQDGDIKSLANKPIQKVDQFVYLGSNIASTEADVNIRLAKAWSALDKLTVIWKSSLQDTTKRNFFQAVVTSVLVYGCTTWTLTKTLEKRIDGNFTRMLRAALNISWTEHPTKDQLYGDLPPISQMIRERRMRFAGHCWRSKQELISDILLWTPKHGHSSVGRPSKTYLDQLSEDAGCPVEHLPTLMSDRKAWRGVVARFRANQHAR